MKTLEVYFLQYKTEERKQKYLLLVNFCKNIYGIRCNENGENPQRLVGDARNLLYLTKENKNTSLYDASSELETNLLNFLEYAYYSGDKERFERRFKELFALLPKENIQEFKI